VILVSFDRDFARFADLRWTLPDKVDSADSCARTDRWTAIRRLRSAGSVSKALHLTHAIDCGHSVIDLPLRSGSTPSL
jgi:hypothetical protein